MLRHLSIKNVAVIESCDIDFDKGFNVLTGETGAGKSIIIDAINMLKGERMSKELIRSGTDKARVDGVFEVPPRVAKEVADILGTDEETEIMVSREMSSDGKNTVRINGITSTVSLLKTIGENLVNIHGQHDNVSLLSVKSHIVFLDRFGKEKTASLLNEYKDKHTELKNLTAELDKITTDEKEKLRRQDMLLFQIEELEQAQLVANEEEELMQKKLMLDNAELIAKNTQSAYEMLYGADSHSCHDIVWKAINMLEQISSYSDDIASVASSLTDAAYIIDEKSRELRSLCDSDSYDEAQKDAIDKRLDLIYSLERKYGKGTSSMLLFLQNAKEELDALQSSDERAEAIRKRIALLEVEREKAADELSEQRKDCARLLEEQVKAHLADLDMAKVDFEVKIDKTDFGPDGADNVEFLICTNVGEEKKSLCKIASGGELSRIMLSIKNALASCEESKTMIFDEIDTGVSGKAAQKIGEKLFSMSLFSQVLCITHLPQISSLADTHYLIKKNIENERTLTVVEPLDSDKRADEVARTLGGEKVSDIAKENARQMLSDAIAIKKRIRG